ncbi:MAG: hypothetical protein M1840_001598 [Geoglossum simile]|nr:MAG: hypothetical protein M1840_001598 [Geoglossum simile]
MHSVSTSEELSTRIKADVSATIPLEGMTIEASSSYLRETKITKKTLLQIIEDTTWEQPKKVTIGELKLSQKASDILGGENGLKEFRTRYGDYFIYGYQRRSKFSAICKINASSESTRDEIKTKLAAKGGNVGAMSAELEYMSKREKENISIDINMRIAGVKQGGIKEGEATQTEADGAIPPDDAKPLDIVKFFNYYQNNMSPVPCTALLCHYSAIDTRFPCPEDQFKEFGELLGAAFQELFFAQCNVISSPMVRASEVAEEITRVCRKIEKLDLNDKKAVDLVISDKADCLQEAKKWGLRHQLLIEAKKCENTSIPNSEWIYAKKPWSWCSGMEGTENFIFPGFEPKPWKYDLIRSDFIYYNDRYNPGYRAGYQYDSITLGSHSVKIIHWSVLSGWQDDTNGWWKHTSGGILNSEITSGFCTQSGRGGDWWVNATAVDKLQYELRDDV